MVKISVIIPVYNVSEYLRDCLDSLFVQSLKGIEVICINDGSTDNSYNILCEYMNIHNNMIVVNQENKGQSAARNIGVGIAKGKYITFLDSDDLIEPDYLKVMFDCAEESQLDYVITGYSKFYSKIKKKKLINNNVCILSSEDLYKKYMVGIFPTMVWARLYKRDIWLGNHLSFPEGKIYEDIFLSFQIADVYKKAIYIDGNYYHYRIRENSSVFSFTEKKLLDYLADIKKTNIFLEKKYLPYYDKNNQIYNCHLFNARMYAFYLNSKLIDKKSLSEEINSYIHRISKTQILFNRYIGLNSKLKFLLRKMHVEYSDL